MTTPTSALIRNSLAALREHEHNVSGPWHPRPTGVVAEDGSNVGMLIVESYNPKTDAHLMRHIALLASPDVATALADLLDARVAETFALLAWQTQKTLANSDALEDAQHALTRAFVTVEQAISKRGQMHMKLGEKV